MPFILKAGKALETTQTLIRLQFKKVCRARGARVTRTPPFHSRLAPSSRRAQAPPQSLFGEQPQNELVIRIQPNEAIYYKILSKMTGAASSPLILLSPPAFAHMPSRPSLHIMPSRACPRTRAASHKCAH